jgi:hypothetical protein
MHSTEAAAQRPRATAVRRSLPRGQGDAPLSSTGCEFLAGPPATGSEAYENRPIFVAELRTPPRCRTGNRIMMPPDGTRYQRLRPA